MVDLDLDVVVSRAGDLFVDDEDEFEEHQRLLHYPDEIIVLARSAADQVHAAIAEGVEPFAGVGHARLEAAAAAWERGRRDAVVPGGR